MNIENRVINCPVVMPALFHERMKRAAKKDNNKTLKEFIIDAIEEKITEVEKREA
jgi:hypothetical protein